MSHFSATTFNTKNYAEARPTYVSKIYELIESFHVGKRDAIVDAGCGPGMGTEGLLNLNFETVYAVDPAIGMIEEGKKRPLGSKIEWLVGSGENLSQIIPKKVDMVTSFEAVQWMDIDKTWKECYDILNPGGTVAHVMYGRTEVLDNDEATAIIFHLIDEKLRGYFKPQHQTAFGLMDNIEPPSWAKRVERHKFLTKPKEGENGCIMTRETNLEALAAQILSWSPTDLYLKEHPNEDLVGDTIEKIMEVLGAKDLNHPVTMAWSMAVLLVSK
ncbi:S-adenosyl-L-methionine-dependent methyltransferase [Wallemia mellicola]|nr:S-adenosyl-L-methionine-dependent methyltransferase [Wallemia mellicola]